MKQAQFVAQHQALWQRIAQAQKNASSQRVSAEEKSAWVRDYRALSQHLAIARTRAYSPLLVRELENLTQWMQQQLYHVKPAGRARAFLRFFTQTFPQSVRREWHALALSALLFFGLGAAVGVFIYFKPDWIYYLMGHEQVEGARQMYDPANPMIGRAKADFNQSRLLMFGFYVYNNTGIGLRVFASGILCGVGTVLQLVMNALSIGAIAGYLTQLGYIKTFWGFVAGHSAFELGAITISGASGLILGRGVIKATTLRRLDYLAVQARRALPLIAGASVMFVLAAFIEGFWSPAPDVPVTLKYVVGVGLIVLTLLYFIVVGRQSELEHSELENELEQAIAHSIAEDGGTHAA